MVIITKFYLKIIIFVNISQIKALPNIFNNFLAQDETIVTIPKLGKISGLIKSSADNSNFKYYQYKGIPFAEPVERFSLPKPKLPWNGIHNGKIEGKVCPQPGGNFFYLGHIDEKNCLTLTITTPLNPNNFTSKLPVVVFFYGGAFIIGATFTSWYNPKYLVQENIVIVQVNYRLGILGWLSDGKIIPQNLGLKDSKLALEYIQSNIEYFGGDPNQVTIYGQSVGAVICDALWQSERTQHLFRAVFLQSGTLINPHTCQKNPAAAFKTALMKSICVWTLSLSVKHQVACLKKLSDFQLSWSSAITYAWDDTIKFGTVKGLTAAIVIENILDPNAIVIENPLERLMKGKFPRDKPIMISITSEERFTFEMMRSSLRDKSNEAIVPGGINTNDRNKVGKAIKIHYGGSEEGFNQLSYASLLRASSDIFYNNGFRRFIELVQPHLYSNNGIYCMEFAYASKLGRFNNNDKVGHVEDLFYSWGLEAIGHENLRRWEIPKEAYMKRKQLNKLISNFVKFRQPTPTSDKNLEEIIWPKVDDIKNVSCLQFNSKLKIVTNPKNENYDFWMKLYSNYTNEASPNITL